MNVFLEQVREDEFPAFKKKLQEAFTSAAKRQLPGISDEPIPSNQDIEESFYSPKAETYHIIHQGKKVGGVVVSIDKETHHNSLDLFFISTEHHNSGLGYAAWNAIEARYPEAEVWETVTPYFEKRNIHFYVNKCGFHIVEFYNEQNPDPYCNNRHGNEMPESLEDGMFRFEKIMGK